MAEKNKSSNGREIHSKATQATESEKYSEAVKLIVDALEAYAEDEDHHGFSEACAQLFNIEQHLYRTTHFEPYLIKAKHSAMAGVEIARKSGDMKQLGLPLFGLAKALEDLGELPKAIETYREAVDVLEEHSPFDQPRPAVIADIKNHLAVAEYNAGDESALDRAFDAVEAVENAEDPDPYALAVWATGGHMRIAKMLKDENPAAAEKHIQAAEKIISEYESQEHDQDLSIRKQQLTELKEKLA